MFDSMILDGHCHLASVRYVPEAFLAGVASNLVVRAKAYGNRALDFEQLCGVLRDQHQDHEADLLISEMDAAGITSSVLLYPDFGAALSGCPEPEVAIRQHAAVCERHAGRFHLFAGIDPRREQAIERFQYLLEPANIRGLKLYPACGYSCSDRRLYPFYDLCAARGLPVLFHTGPTTPTLGFEYTDPRDIDRAALDFPTVGFVIGHGGVHNTEQSSLLCAYRPNVYMDISSFVNTLDARGWKQQLAALFRQRINHKIIFGTDWPVARKAGGLARLVAEFLADDGPLAGLAKADCRLILAENMLRLLGN